ncbi:MAG: hypothetical protein JO069_11760 [Verrucomicrobia bacterium]|nr:hypothetical protein [Verrucomicrobiota bacterium]
MKAVRRLLLSQAFAWLLFCPGVPAKAGLLTQFREWQAQQSARSATQALKEQKLDEALVAARRALQLDPRNTDALEVMAQISGKDVPAEEVKWRQRLTQLTPQSADAWLSLAQAALNAKQYQTANDALGRVPEQNRALRFYRIAASLALAVNNRPEAIGFFHQAVSQPGSTNADRFNPAALELFSGIPDRVAAAKAELAALSADPDLAEKCHRLLASFAVSTGDLAGATPHVDYLLGRPQVQFEDVLIALDLFLQNDRARFDQLLHNCLVRFKDEPLPASQIVRWLSAKNLLSEAQASVRTVTPHTANDPVFKVAFADTFVRQRDWAGLQDYTKDANWGVNDYLRAAYNLEARRELGLATTSEALNGWQECLAKTEQQAERIAALFHLAMGWGWRNEAESALWAAADASADRREALGALWRWYEKDKNTGGLFRVANRMLELNIDESMARNNVVMLGSLLGIKNGAFRDWAQANWENDSGKHPQFGTTYAFALFQAGDLEGATRVLNQIDRGFLINNPDDALYAGIIRAATGDRAEAKRLLEIASRADLLPEEKTLLARGRLSVEQQQKR